MRHLPLVTIDGADARDFDDAVYAEPDGKAKWRLLVAIADVSHYVEKDAPLDNEARRRGTSTYFPGRVVPMLPEELSNGLCSLNPKVDRLCLVCDMRVTANGKVEGSTFYKAVMRSHARLTYNEVHAAVGNGNKQARQKLGELLPAIENLYKVYRGLARARGRRGALDLELPEVVITMAGEHAIESVAPRHRNDAHRLIEECMIAANVQAARFLRKNRLPNLYRVHPQPEPDRFEELRVMLQELGYKVTAEARTRPRALNRILQQLRERPDFPVLATSVLRTMAQALYQPANEGHYGLALEAYAHFTSPIRRYPDLLVHRGISHLLGGGKPGAFAYRMPDMEELGRVTSRLERQAEAASRHVESRYKCIYIRDHVGDEFDGVITAVKHFGLFVMLDGLYVEGLVHVTALGNDYFHEEHAGLRLRGERTGQSYGLGDDRACQGHAGRRRGSTGRFAAGPMSERIVYGINTVLAALERPGADLLRIYLQDDLRGKRATRLHDVINQQRVRVERVSSDELTRLTGSTKHQGVAAAMLASGPLDDSQALALIESLENPLILVLDSIEDPRNFGACLRTADAAGVDLVVTGRSRGVDVTPVVSKVASGAAETQPLARVANLARFIAAMQDINVWVVGADEQGPSRDLRRQPDRSAGRHHGRGGPRAQAADAGALRCAGAAAHERGCGEPQRGGCGRGLPVRVFAPAPLSRYYPRPSAHS